MYYVQHTERWNDLSTHVYHPTKQTILALHPCAALCADASLSKITQFPADLKLLPEHCVELYDAMTTAGLDGGDAKRLAPEVFFCERIGALRAEWDISMRDAKAWEMGLKDAFVRCLSHEQQKSVLTALSARTQEAFEASDRDMDMWRQLYDHLDGLLSQLRDRDMLPCICFHFSQTGCESMARKVTKLLEEREATQRLSEAWHDKVDNAEKRREQLEKLARKLGWKPEDDEQDLDKLANGAELRGVLESLDEAESTLSQLHAVDARYAYTFRGNEVSEEKLREFIGDHCDDENYQWLFQAMLRGIGVHHSGMNLKWRQAVERLFRIKKLAVVFATGTLALGINMPCKTSVFLGDAVYFNAMNYRQMSGRAGRRGFDLRGNVVFFGVGSHKALRLMRSDLPILQGNVTLTASTVLRLIMRSAELKSTAQKKRSSSGAKANANADVNAAFEQSLESCARLVKFPLFNLNHLMAEQTSHLFRFCVEYLYSQGLLYYSEEHQDVAPNDLGAFISHLHYLEPANFAFLSLLTSGYLDSICDTRDDQTSDTTLASSSPSSSSQSDKSSVVPANTPLRLLTVLCHLFKRIRLPKHTEKEVRKNPSAFGPSVMLLPALDPHALEILDRHNAVALTAVCDYLTCFVTSYATELGADNRLPLTSHTCAASTQDGQDIQCPILSSITFPVKIRSGFQALSGRDDRFSSLRELCGSLRHGLYLDAGMVPTFEAESGQALNSYILDFYKHGQISALVDYNQIRKDDVWELLRDFDLIIKALCAAMERRSKLHAYYGEQVAFCNPRVLAALLAIRDKFTGNLRGVAS